MVDGACRCVVGGVGWGSGACVSERVTPPPTHPHTHPHTQTFIGRTHALVPLLARVARGGREGRAHHLPPVPPREAEEDGACRFLVVCKVGGWVKEIGTGLLWGQGATPIVWWVGGWPVDITRYASKRPRVRTHGMHARTLDRHDAEGAGSAEEAEAVGGVPHLEAVDMDE